MSNACTWILVADGTHARVLEERPRGTRLSERVVICRAEGDEIEVRDRPTGLENSVSEMSHDIINCRDPHQVRERWFLRRVAMRLDHGAAQDEFDQLILFAPPHALSMLHSALSSKSAKAIVAEAGMNLVGENIRRIAERLKALRQEVS